MARSANPNLSMCSGHIGKQIVVKQYGKKTVVSKFPDMSQVKRSAPQKSNSLLFARAVAYAKAICRCAEQKAVYRSRLEEGDSVYRYAMREFFALEREGRG